MKILYLNTTYAGGGAEKVTRQIYDGMKARGHDVYEIVCYNRKGSIEDPNVHVLYSSVPGKIWHRVQTYNRGNHNLTIPYALWYIKCFIKKNKIDVIHLNNPHDNFLGIRDIEQISRMRPMVWTLHDFWAMTGHCAVPAQCDEWKEGCSVCRYLGNYPRLRKDICGRLFRYKRKSFQGNRICFTAPSVWLEQQIRQSFLEKEQVCVIGNSLDTEKWKELDKEKIRRKYGINTLKTVLAFVAADGGNPLKGGKILQKALEELDSSQYFLLTAGKPSAELEKSISGYERKNMGYISKESEMNEFYAMADLVINPSLYETFGLVNLEAMASGTPVIAFAVCAVPEIVTDKVGWCVEHAEASALAEKIREISGSKAQIIEKTSACHEYVVRNFGQKSMLDQYETLYRKLQRT